MNRHMKALLMLISGFGFTASAWAHGMALAQAEIPGGSRVLKFQLGIFVVWVPVIILQYRMARDNTGHETDQNLWTDYPTWLRVAQYLLFFYAAFNLFTTDVPPGWNRIHFRTDDPPLPAIVQIQSSVWMSFYFAAFAMFYSSFRRLSRPAPHEANPETDN
ncbi:MAG: hypothetical protein NT172_20145 [Planctomycetota bacterium]|nr:hypothetical protein [Planctomycetota bacterium]